MENEILVLDLVIYLVFPIVITYMFWKMIPDYSWIAFIICSAVFIMFPIVLDNNSNVLPKQGCGLPAQGYYLAYWVLFTPIGLFIHLGTELILRRITTGSWRKN